MKTMLQALAISFLTVLTVLGQGRLLWDESINGPLANSTAGATALGSLQLGSNTLIGSVQAIPMGPNWLAVNDYFTLSVSPGFQVSRIEYTVDRLSWAWIGDAGFATEYGFVIHPSNGDLLPQWGMSSVSSGVYGAYISNVDLQSVPTTANYRLDFFVQPIPEPSAVWQLLLGLSVGFFWHRKRCGLAR